MLLHKFRRAMVNVERQPLRGKVEVDETWIGGTQAGLRGSRQLKGRKAALVLVAVEKRGQVTGRVRMALIPDFKNTTLLAFLKQNVMPGSTIYTDGLKSFAGLQEAGFEHVPRTQPLRIDLRKGAQSVLPLADRAIGNLQQWLIGTYHGVSRGQLQVYLDEFVFRHNRRGNQWRRSKPCSALEPDASPPHIKRYGAARIFQRRPTKIERYILGFAETTG
jgi:transposase-like protein